MPGLAGEVANLIVALKLDDSGFSGRLNRVSGQLRKLDGGLHQIGRGVGQVGTGLLRLGERAAIAAAGGLTAVVTTAASYEEAFTGVEKTVDATDAQFAKLNETIKRMAGETGTAFEELAGIGETGGALGIGVENLEAFIDVVNRLAVSTPLSADQAATAIGHLRNVLHLSDSDMRAFADSLVALGNAGASTEDQIVEMAARFGAAARAAGVSNEGILALSSTVASMGIEVEAGGSSLSRLFNNITTQIGTADAKAEALAEGMGMSLEQLRDAWDKDAAGVFQELLKHINELDQFEAAAFLKGIGITNVRDVNAIRLLSQGYEEYARQLGVAENAQGALNTESDKFFNTTAAGFRKFKENVRNALDTIGQQLLPVVNEQMQAFVGWLTKPETQRAIKAFAEDLARGLRSFIDEIKGTDFSGLIGGIKLAAQVAKGAFDAFRALPQPIQQLAIAALVANRLSGGAIGLIARGLGNIVLGGTRVGAGLLGMRGGTPATPMFVKEVGLGGLGRGGPGGGPVAAGGRGGGGLGLLGRLLGAAAVAELTFEFRDEIQGFGADLSKQLFPDGAPLEGVGDFFSNLQWPFGPKGAPDWARFDPAPGKVIGGGVEPSATKRGLPKNDPATAAGSDAVLRRFGEHLPKLATNEVIEHLARTNEIGLKGVGTTFQVGLTNGLDPIGSIATQILTRAEDPKAPAVMREIQGHLAGLEEIQATYLRQGDVSLAQKVQQNIDTLHGLIGTTDAVRAVAEFQRADAARADQTLIQTAQRANEYQSRTANAAEATSRKDFNPEVTLHNNITIPVRTYVNARVVQDQLHKLRVTTNSGGFI